MYQSLSMSNFVLNKMSQLGLEILLGEKWRSEAFKMGKSKRKDKAWTQAPD